MSKVSHGSPDGFVDETEPIATHQPNTVGRPVTYAATSPSMCVLEKLVHIEDPDLLPTLAMVVYDLSDDMPVSRLTLTELPQDWRRREAET